MDEKQLQFLFNEYAKGKGFKDFSEFKSLMLDDKSRRVFFDESNKELGFKDFADFDNTLGLKKKEPSVSSSTQLQSPKNIEITAGLTELPKKQKSFEEVKPTAKAEFKAGGLPEAGTYDELAAAKATPFIRGILQGRMANLASLNRTPTNEELVELASLNKQLQEIGQSDATAQFDKEGFSLFGKDPLKGAEFLLETIGNSLASMVVAGKETIPQGVAMGATAGTVLPAFGTLSGAGVGLTTGMATAGLNVSTSQKILDVLTESGIDVTDEKSLIKGFADEKLMAKARKKAALYGIPLFIFDVASSGLAGRMSAAAIGKPLSKRLVAGAGDITTQSAMGAAGEATGQYLSEGKVNLRDVGVEALASLATDIPEVVIGAGTRLARKDAASNNKTLATQIATLGKDAGVEDARMNLDRDLKNGVIDEVEYEEGVKFVEKAAELSDKIPETVVGEERAKSIELIAERDKLKEDNEVFEMEKQSLDEAYQIPVDEKIKENQDRIEEINTEVAKLATKKPKGEPEQITQPIELSIEPETVATITETVSEPIQQTTPTTKEQITETTVSESPITVGQGESAPTATVLEGEGLSQKGIERAEAKKIYKKVNETDIPNDAEGIALSYLAGGGKVSEAAINEVAGRVKRARLNTGERELKTEEAKARDYYQKEGKSLDDIAHELWEASNQEVPESEIKDALMDAIGSYNTRLEAGRAFLERYNPEYAEEQYYNQLYEQKKAEVEAEEAEISKWLAEEGEREFKLAADEEYINQLIKKYETDIETEIEQPTTKSKGTGDTQVSSKESGTKPTAAETKPIEPPKPPTTPPKEEGKADGGSEREVALEHAATEEKRAEYGMEERTLREVKKDEQLNEEANEAIRNGYDVKSLIKRIINRKHLPTDKEHTILLKYAAGLEAKLEKLDPASKEFEDTFEELNNTYKASEVGGSELGAAFRARQSRVFQEDSLGEMLVREAEVNMVEELTPEQRENVVKEYEAIKKAKEEWEKKYNELQADQLQKEAEAKIVETKRQSTGKKKSKDDYKKERESIKDAIKNKWKKAANDGTLMAIPVPYAKQLAAISPDVAKLMKSYVEEGVTELSEIVAKIHEDVKDFVDGITENDIRDVIAGVYTEKRTRNEMASQLRDLRDEAKLINALEKLEAGEIPNNPKAKVERNRKITELRSKIKSLKRDLINGKSIDGEPVNKKVESLKKRLQAQIAELEDKLSKGDYAKEPKKDPIKLDREAQELKDKLIKLKQEREIRLLQQEYANRTKAQKAKDLGIEILNVPRTIMASIDFSAPLRQGIIATISHPKIASMAFREMFRQAFSQKRFDRWFYDLRESPTYDVMEKSGLYIADPHDPKLSAKEEQFMNNLAEKIPFIGKLIKGSERAYVSYLNKMRADLFIKGMQAFEAEGKTLSNSEQLYKDLSSFINNATGRGKMAKVLEDSAPLLNAAFFSPRLMASRINLLNLLYYGKLSPEIRKMAMKDVGAFLTFGLSLLALAGLAGADIEKDPRSPNFLKIKVGDTTYDIWGGFQQYLVELSQLVRGETKSATTGEIRSLSGKEFPFKTRGDDIQSFVRGKLAPVPAATMNLLTGKKVTGERTDAVKELTGMIMPLMAKDAYEAFSKEGVLGGFATLIPATFGVGVQSLSNIPQNADKNSPVWKFISEKKVRVPQPDFENLKVGKDKRNMTKEEIYKFERVRLEKLEDFIKKIMSKGVYVVENEKSVYKKGNQLTREQLNDFIEKASKKITAQVKEELFGKVEKSLKQEFAEELSDILNEQLER